MAFAAAERPRKMRKTLALTLYDLRLSRRRPRVQSAFFGRHGNPQPIDMYGREVKIEPGMHSEPRLEFLAQGPPIHCQPKAWGVSRMTLPFSCPLRATSHGKQIQTATQAKAGNRPELIGWNAPSDNRTQGPANDG
jgi:hypothetical protein